MYKKEIMKTTFREYRTDYGQSIMTLRDEMITDSWKLNQPVPTSRSLSFSNHQLVSFELNDEPEDSLLDKIIEELVFLSVTHSGSNSAIPLIPALSKLRDSDIGGILHSQGWKYGKHVLVSDEFLKLVLIIWCPGEKVSIHGHPAAGCVFTVLEGVLHESRYTDQDSQRPLNTSIYSRGSIAYIDDRIGLHTVHNPGDDLAVSLHAYMPDV